MRAIWHTPENLEICIHSAEYFLGHGQPGNNTRLPCNNPPLCMGCLTGEVLRGDVAGPDVLSQRQGNDVGIRRHERHARKFQAREASFASA